MARLVSFIINVYWNIWSEKKGRWLKFLMNALWSYHFWYYALFINAIYTDLCMAYGRCFCSLLTPTCSSCSFLWLCVMQSATWPAMSRLQQLLFLSHIPLKVIKSFAVYIKIRKDVASIYYIQYTWNCIYVPISEHW